MIVVTIVGNDFDESLIRYKSEPAFYYFDDSKGDMPLVRVDWRPSLKVRFARNSALTRYLLLNGDVLGLVDRLRGQNTINYIGNVQAAVEAERVERSKRAVDVFLARLFQAAALPTSRIVFIVDGIRPNLYSEDELRKAQGSYIDVMRRYFTTQATEHGYKVVDMQPLFIERHRVTGEKFEYPDDAHWNDTGHAVAAEAIKATEPFQELFGS